MEWVINFNYNISTPIFYEAKTELVQYYSRFNEGEINTSNNNSRKDIADKIITSGLQRNVGRNTTFGLYVECKVGEGNVIKLGNEFGEKFRTMLAPLLWIAKKLDGDMGINAAREEEVKLKARNKGIFARLSKLPMSFILDLPNIGAGVRIQSLSQNGVLTYELNGRLIANPIVEAHVKLDILALGSRFKPWGAIIDALDLASWLTNLFSGGRLEIDYELYASLTAKISLVGSDSKDGNVTEARVKYNFATKMYTGTIALQGVLEGAIVFSASLQYKISYEKGRQVSLVDDNEKKRKAFEIGIEIEGKAMVSYTVGREFGNGGNWDTDFYFSGFTLSIKIKAGGFNKEEKDLLLIPKVNKTINIFKNVGEYN